VRIRLRFTLELDARRRRDDAADETPEQRDTQLDALVGDVEQRHDAPRIGFGTFDTE
jgi:hypothetical protein